MDPDVGPGNSAVVEALPERLLYHLWMRRQFKRMTYLSPSRRPWTNSRLNRMVSNRWTPSKRYMSDSSPRIIFLQPTLSNQARQIQRFCYAEACGRLGDA